MAPSTIRKAIGAVKDQTSIGIAKVASNMAPDLEVAVVKATSHDDDPADDKYIREILNFLSLSRGYVHACVSAVSKRLGKTRDWIVALKSLVLVHRLLSEGDPLFQQEMMYATRRGTRVLNMSDFRDEAHSNSWDHSAFVRTYAMYLDQRLELMIFERKSRSAGGGSVGGGGEKMQSANGSDPQQPQQSQQNQQQQQAQQWMAMQYPAAAMVMQHQMMPPQHYPPQHYLPYHQYQHQHQHVQHQQQQQQLGSNGENKTVWVGDLHQWMDENYLHSCFGSTGELTSIKVIRNKQTGLSEGYGFVEFFSRAAAEKVLQTYASIMMPNTEQPFRLNWATFSMGDKRSDNGSDLSIFVGDLASDVTDSLLHETFASRYPSVKGAKVVFDANTGRSKGYGFVRFGDDNEKSQAMTEMNGVYCSSRPMRIGAATPRKSSAYQQQYSSQGGYASNGASVQSDGDSMNTTIFVGGLDPNVTDEDLRQPFSQYGEIVSVKIPVGKGCGFVQFANRNHAEEALQKLNGTVIGKQTVRLSWGRNPANKQLRADFGNQWSGAYYGGQVYDGYGYALPAPQDPSMYAAAAAAYGAYPVYGNHQQQVS